MISMPKNLDKYVQTERTRHGKVIFYYRRGKGKRIRLPNPNDNGYEAAYQAARNGSQKAPIDTPSKRSISWLIKQYMHSSAFSEYSVTTRKQRSYIYKEIEEKAGFQPYSSITKKTILNGKENRMHTPNQARMFLDAMRGLFLWAFDNEHVSYDPTKGIKNPKRTNSDGFEAWTEEDVAKFEAMYPEGKKERLWLHVLLYTGVRKGDAVIIGKQHVKDGLISLNTEKTNTTVYRAFDPRLGKTLEASQTGDLHFIVGSNGNPLNKDTFGNYFRKAAQKAGIYKPMHGIRKLSATIAAEQGLTDSELEALFGWTGGGMAKLYTKKASKKRLALSAAEKMQTGQTFNIAKVENK